MKNLFNSIYLFVVFLFFNVTGYAQLYPVQLTPVFNSPYSVKISDYAASMDTKMQLLINPTDISISQRRVRLKLYIQGNGLNIQTSDYAQEQRPIYINGGELQTLTNVDIASLFRLENLQGISAAQYANPLPEGMYNFCFEMYDFVTNQKISQKSCASLYLILNDPPILNTPQKNEQIASTEFPNILFTWTPRQINATNVSYKFELKQLLDPSLDPQIGFQMSPTLYEETLFGTALLYNLSMPILTPGLRYAWRVRAISTTGLSENAIFKNDGYSEIYSFKYTASCAAPTFLLSEAQSSKSVKITWEGIPEHTRYQVQYKKQDVRNAQWFSSNSLNRQSLIINLEPGVTYQFRVGSSCDPAEDGVQSFTYSNISTFTTPTETSGVPAYNCGIVPQINIQNQKPLTNLIQSETFKAGDFPVTILELQGQNSPYSGRGYIIVPYLADTKIAVEFKDIVINTDYQLISGIVETSYNPDWKNVVNIADDIKDVVESTNEIADLINEIFEKLKELKDDGLISEKEMQEVIVQTNQQKEKVENANKILQDSKNNTTIDENITGGAQKAIEEAENELEKKQKELFAKSKTSIKFVAFENSFENKETLGTMFTDQDLIIKIVLTDTISKIDLGKLKYILEKNELTVKQKDKEYFVSIKADKTTLKEGKNELKVLDETGKTVLSKLIIASYYAPIVKFSKTSNYAGEFLFDDAFEMHNVLKSQTYYKSVLVGKNKERYFAPVIGLQINEEAELKIKVEDFDDAALKDPNFKLIFEPSLNNKIMLNNQARLELSALELRNLLSLRINARDYINGRNLDSLVINVYAKGTNFKSGKIEYYCAQPINKRIHLIYTRFIGETTYPNQFTALQLQTYLNRSALNQFFINVQVDQEQFEVNANRALFLANISSSSNLFYSLLNRRYVEQDLSVFSATQDFYFITNIEQKMPGTENYLGGAHLNGSPGGLQVKNKSEKNETDVELAAHEFGHWVGLPHTFESSANIPLINTTHGATKNNFMDYNVNRKTWFKVHLTNTNRESN
ncbi:hypothetical protein [Flavobacterium johnsoniae]|uniref:TANFOR domain-containing protein n=1 Tax=Flavobacterium johnsoniae TaxID=986 RepID=A0A1M5FNL1_FLAJO|nr:hypothetical protein [Flavobacterium johnsoniae]SHF93076.1 TANFOR domain-containing protein [Flavobacterium johnsoniae]